MQIHGDDMVAASRLQHIGHELSRNWGSRLVLFVLAGIGEIWNNCRDAACRSRLASIDDNQEFHEAIVDITGSSGLQDEYFGQPPRVSVNRIDQRVAGI